MIERKLKGYLQKINPKILGFNQPLEIKNILRLASGESNLNYQVLVNKQTFLIRLSMTPSQPRKLAKEFEILLLLKDLRIAPKPYHYENSSEEVGVEFSILEFLEGENLHGDNSKIFCSKDVKGGIIPELAKLVAILHSVNIPAAMRNRLRGVNPYAATFWGAYRKRIMYLMNKWEEYRISNELTSFLQETVEKARDVKIHFRSDLVLGHGDIAPQNVLLHKGKLFLIDWEDARLLDPAQDLVILFDSFDLSLEQQKSFLEVYLNLRSDDSLQKRILALWPWQVFGTFLWAIGHVFEIGDRELHVELVQQQDLAHHIEYTEKTFRKCTEAALIPKKIEWNVEKLFPELFILS
ncbi:MAG: aminoglycoside phosphotransferase family protein [Candidatus Hodarchaeota archaeon]